MRRDVGPAAVTRHLKSELFDDDIKVNAHVAGRSRECAAWYRPTWRIRGVTGAFAANLAFFAPNRWSLGPNISARSHAALRRAAPIGRARHKICPVGPNFGRIGKADDKAPLVSGGSRCVSPAPASGFILLFF